MTKTEMIRSIKTTDKIYKKIEKALHKIYTLNGHTEFYVVTHKLQGDSIVSTLLPWDFIESITITISLDRVADIESVLEEYILKMSSTVSSQRIIDLKLKIQEKQREKDALDEELAILTSQL